MTFQALSWYIPVYTRIYWYILFYLPKLWYIRVYARIYLYILFTPSFEQVHPSTSWYIPACPGSTCLNMRRLCSWLYPAGPAESSPFSFKFYAFVTQQGQAPTTLFLHRNAPPLPRGRRTPACAGLPAPPARPARQAAGRCQHAAGGGAPPPARRIRP